MPIIDTYSWTSSTMLPSLSLPTALALVPLATSTAASLLPVSRPAQSYALCQKKTQPPLLGCPPHTIYVSQASHPDAKFSSIQAAIASLPNNDKPHVILIAPGTYTEQLNVTRPGPLTLLGTSDRPWRAETLAGSAGGRGAGVDDAFDYGAPLPANDVQVYFNSANVGNNLLLDNVFTGVLTIGPTLNATFTGAGPNGWPVDPATPFGSADFRAYNIDFRNEFSDRSVGPAHALGVSRANAGFYSCGFYSYQDTIYIGKLGNAYFHDTIVAGQTDFLYGFGTLFISKSLLSLRNCGGGITAWKGTNTTSPSNPSGPASSSNNKYGVYISHTQFRAANSTIAPVIKDKCSLGRPWNDIHRSVIMRSYFDPSILPQGYTGWTGKPPNNNGIGPGTVMAVHDVYGPGYDAAAVAAASNVTKVFDRAQARPYLRPADVFVSQKGKPDVKWLDPVAWLP
ncbi:pectin lyase fold/virulence factor [Microdochium bolleyi]|uniref:pectinesterase n=1 Tax=Microdochium bolleyi TaxID=196109 RepID=A0A136JA06_9PEZI|nr:pectin lyase fold/virulence factor [Microdochium bolleyi]